MKSLWVIILSLAVLGPGVCAQTAGAAAQRAQVAGVIASVDAGAKRISIKSDKGETVTVTATDRSFFRRLPAGETDMKKAVPLAFSDLAVGDQVVASYQVGSDQKTLEVRTILIRTKSDLAQIREKEMEDWQKRGTVGNVGSVDAAAQTFTVKAGARIITVQPSDKTVFLRYAPDSAKIDDAKPSAFTQLKVGDEVHVLGDRNAEGTSLAAEKVVFGSFRQIAATIQSVDLQTGELKVKNLAVKKGPPVILKVTADTQLKKLPPQLAAMWARRYAPGAQASAQNGGGRGEGGRPSGMMGRGPGGMRGGGGGDIKQILDRLPATPLTDLKPGDAIMVTTTEGSDASHLTAIMLLAGVEPVLTAAPNSTRDIMSGWNLGGGEGGEGN
jgi:Cu/Ag efflux protein CusF